MTACASCCSSARSACMPLAARLTNWKKNNMPSWPGRRLNTMPSELLKPDMAAHHHPELLSFLKGKDNPFDLFVAARKPDANFCRYHVPSVHRDVYEPLSAVLDRYRLDQLERESDLPRSGVLVIQGIRGTGKTHMVHALQKAVEHGSPRIVVTPAI